MLNRNGFGVVRGVMGALAIATSLLSSACSSSPPALPRAAVDSQLGAGTQMGATTMCPLGIGMSWIGIGSDTSDPITTGTGYNGDPVTVSCTVHPSSGGYNVTLSALLGGQGSISVVNSTINSDPTQVSTGVTATFERAANDFHETDCTWDFGGQSTDIDPNKSAGNPLGIAGGRIWGNLTCPMTVDSEHTLTCLGVAELRFENCGQ